MTVRPGCVTWSIVPEPPQYALRDPDTGEPGVRLEFRTEDGALAAAEHRAATMFTWWDGLPGIGPGGRGRIVLRTSYLAVHDGPHVIGAGGVGRLRLTVNGTEVASGHPDLPADPVEAMVRPGEIRAVVDLAAGREAEIEVCLRPDDWPQGPVAIRLGVASAPDDDAMLARPSRRRARPTPLWWWSAPRRPPRARGSTVPGSPCRAGRTNSCDGWRR